MSAIFHIIPENDQVDHEISFGCICGPDITDEYGGWLVSHHSLDGREKDELAPFTRPVGWWAKLLAAFLYDKEQG